MNEKEKEPWSDSQIKGTVTIFAIILQALAIYMCTPYFSYSIFWGFIPHVYAAILMMFINQDEKDLGDVQIGIMIGSLLLTPLFLIYSLLCSFVGGYNPPESKVYKSRRYR